MNLLLVTHHRRSKAYLRPFPFARAIAERGHRVELVMIADHARLKAEHWEEHGVRCVALPDLLWGRMRSGWDPWSGLNLAGLMLRRRPDLVHLFETRPAIVLPALAVRPFMRPRPALATDWNDWWSGPTGIVRQLRPAWYRRTLGPIEEWFETAFRAKGDGATVISEPLRQRALALGVPAERMAIVREGTDPDRIPAPTKEECRAALGLPLDAPLLGFASVDSPVGSAMVLNALERARARHPRVRLVVTGHVEPNLQRMVAERGLTESVLFTGYVSLDDMYRYLGASDFCVLPLARHDYNLGRWPNKFCDYVTVGRAVVVNRVGDVASFVERYDCGAVAADGADAFADEVLRLLDHPEETARLGANARHLAEHDLRWEHEIDKLEAFYRDTIAVVARR